MTDSNTTTERLRTIQKLLEQLGAPDLTADEARVLRPKLLELLTNDAPADRVEAPQAPLSSWIGAA